MKKTIALLLASIMIIAMFSACQSNPTSTVSSGQSAASSAATQPSSASPAPEREKQTSFTILYGKDVHEISPELMEAFIVREQESGIKIIWDAPPLANFPERYNLVMASGDLPDTIINFPSNDIQKYAAFGAIIPLDEIMQEYAPNFMARFNAVPDIPDTMVYGDGHIYYFPFLQNEVGSNRPWSIRKDWLDQLGLDAPVTIDEWHTVLVAFRDMAPGIVPISGIWQGNTQPLGNLLEMAGAFGVLPADSFYCDPYDGDGMVKCANISDGYKETLKVLAQWYSEGLIDKELITNDTTAFNAKVAQNLVGVFKAPINGSLIAFNQSLPESTPGLEYTAVVPMRGPDGYQLHGGSVANVVRGNGRAVITENCKDPITLAEWYDRYSDE